MSRRAALRTPRLPSSGRSLVIGSRKARVDACAWVWCLVEVLWSRPKEVDFPPVLSPFAWTVGTGPMDVPGQSNAAGDRYGI